MNDYREYDHTAPVRGVRTVFASVEFPADAPPREIVIAGIRYASRRDSVTESDSRAEFVGQSVEYVGGYGGAESIESAARTCTQTKGETDEAKRFVQRLKKRSHMSPFEFGFADLIIECDRGIQQELTRHRLFSFLVESTRFIDYRKKPLRFVTKPPKGMTVPEGAIELLEELCEVSADVYDALLEMGAPRDYARKAFPLALASKMRMAGNLRCWVEMLPKRLSPAAHAEVREIANKALGILARRFVGVFEDVEQ